MSSRAKLEKLLEYVVNGEDVKASDLLHDVFVEKARAIYAKKLNEDYDLDDEYGSTDMEEDFLAGSDDDLDEFNDEIDHEEMYEDEDMEDEDMDMDMEDEDMDMEDEDMDMEDEDESEASDAFMNVEDAIAELRAVFDYLIGDEDEMEDSYDDSEYDYESSEDFDSGEDMDIEDEEENVSESVDLKKVATPSNNSEKSMSAVRAVKSGEQHRKAPVYSKNEEKGRVAAKPKDMKARAPQDNATKMHSTKAANGKEKDTNNKSLM